MEAKKYVRTKGAFGPRGDYYEWCYLLDNGSLRFGNEQGNYCGGAVLSYNFFPKDGMPSDSYPIDYPVTDEYWKAAREYLEHTKKIDIDFYDKILKMCLENHAVDAIVKGFGMAHLEGIHV